MVYKVSRRIFVTLHQMLSVDLHDVTGTPGRPSRHSWLCLCCETGLQATCMSQTKFDDDWQRLDGSLREECVKLRSFSNWFWRKMAYTT